MSRSIKTTTLLAIIPNSRTLLANTEIMPGSIVEVVAMGKESYGDAVCVFT